MQITEKGVREELEKFFTSPDNHVSIRKSQSYFYNKELELRVKNSGSGMTQMLKEHFARYTNVSIE